MFSSIIIGGALAQDHEFIYPFYRSAKIVKGKKIAGYYSLEDDIKNAGAIYTDKPAVVDGKFVTTAHYKDMGSWMKATLSFFNEK